MDKDFWMRVRAVLIEQEKGLAMQRAAVIAQRKAIERMLNIPSEVAPIRDVKDGDTLTPPLPYSV